MAAGQEGDKKEIRGAATLAAQGGSGAGDVASETAAATAAASVTSSVASEATSDGALNTGIWSALAADTKVDLQQAAPNKPKDEIGAGVWGALAASAASTVAEVAVPSDPAPPVPLPVAAKVQTVPSNRVPVAPAPAAVARVAVAKVATAASATPAATDSKAAGPQFLVAESLNRPLWKSLFFNVKDALFPPKQAPLILTSRPLDPSEQRFTLEEKSTIASLLSGIKGVMNPEKQAPLVLTSKPVGAGEQRFTVEQPSLIASLVAGVKGLFAPPPPPLVLTSRPVAAGEEHFTVEQPGLIASLVAGVKGIFAPAPPPLVLTSKPVEVKKLWGFYDHSWQGAMVSVGVHVLAIAAVLAFFLWPRSLKIKPALQDSENLGNVTLTLPPSMGPAPHGGGGGGESALTKAPKGALPQTAKLQLTPPRVKPLDNPKLPAAPTILADLKTQKLPDLGDPFTKVALAPPTNGTGNGGGIGDGKGTGVGPGTGPGFGPGNGGNYGGGNYQAGKGGVGEPRVIYKTDPEYSEEARKAKYQGTVVLWLVVGPDGRAHDIRVQRSLGLGLDEKALEAVKQWKFEPAKLNGNPVAVAVNVEVDFRLY